jgi:hypothetical protein
VAEHREAEDEAMASSGTFDKWVPSCAGLYAKGLYETGADDIPDRRESGIVMGGSGR